jgi:hypothetical protein
MVNGRLWKLETVMLFDNGWLSSMEVGFIEEIHTEVSLV